MTRAIRLVVAAFLVASQARAQGEAAPTPPNEPAAMLAAAEAELAALRIDAALARVEALLSRQDLDDERRVEALVIRAKAHAADNKLAATEEDYRNILTLRPDWTPTQELAAPKLVQRFEKVRAATVGSVQVKVKPVDATVFVDDRPRTVAPDGTLRVLAGDRRFRIERRGFDPAEAMGKVEPGGTFDLAADLVPNSRPTRIVTDVPGVEVRLGDRLLGVTARSAEGDEPLGGAEEAELVVEEMPLGPRTLLLSKPCFRPRTLPVSMSADLLDRTPVRVEAPPMEPSRGTVRFVGGSAAARLVIDGEDLGAVPAEATTLCAGPRRVEVRAGGRSVFAASIEVSEDAERIVPIVATPSLALVGTEDRPPALASVAASMTVRATLPLPRGADLRRPEGWDAVSLPADVDLAAAVVPAADPADPPTLLLMSPILRTVERLTVPLESGARPVWRVPWFGLRVADDGAVVRVVEVVPGSPAAAAGIAAGDVLSAIDGRSVGRSRDARAALAAAGLDVPSPLTVVSPGAAPRVVPVVPAASPYLDPGRAQAGADAVLAAFAAVDALASDKDASSASANLALALARAGRYERAAEVWSRVVWPERPGIGPGTAAYHRGVALSRLGQERETEAREALVKARGSAATTRDDGGPAVAPAAADHLADLGVGPS